MDFIKQFSFGLFIALFFLPTSLFGQDEVTSTKLKHGLRVGVNYHWQVEGDFTFDSDIGFLAGYSLTKPLNSLLEIQGTVQYIQQGWLSNNTIFTNVKKIHINRNYINVNMTVNLTAIKGFHIKAGGYIGGLVESNQNRLFDNDKYFKEDLNDTTKFDAGTVLGAELRLKKFGISLEYYGGIINNNNDVVGDFEFLNRGTALILGYTF